MTALRILCRLDHARGLSLLARAIDEDDADVATVAISLPGESNGPMAAELLIDALKARRHPRTGIAVHVAARRSVLANAYGRSSPMPIRGPPLGGDALRPLSGRRRPRGRSRLAARDADPGVREAAIQSLVQIGDTIAASTALLLLDDPIAFVRAAAVRAIGALERVDLAEDVLSQRHARRRLAGLESACRREETTCPSSAGR